MVSVRGVTELATNWAAKMTNLRDFLIAHSWLELEEDDMV